MPNTTTEKIIKDIVKRFKIELEKTLDEGFPKIYEETPEKKANKRSEALMLYATAVIELEKSLAKLSESIEREILENAPKNKELKKCFRDDKLQCMENLFGEGFNTAMRQMREIINNLGEKGE